MKKQSTPKVEVKVVKVYPAPAGRHLSKLEAIEIGVEYPEEADYERSRASTD